MVQQVPERCSEYGPKYILLVLLTFLRMSAVKYDFKLRREFNQREDLFNFDGIIIQF